MLTRLSIFTALALATAALLGCGSDEAGDSAAEATAASAATHRARRPEPVRAAGAEHVGLSDVLSARISIPSPDWMVSAFGSLWVKRDDGGVVRIDPGTGKVIAQVAPGPVGLHSCQGIGASEDAIWSCPPGGGIVRIDPATNTIEAKVRIEKLPDQGRLVSAAGLVWVLTDSGAKLTAIDPRDDAPARTVALDGRCTDLAAAAATLWAMCPFDGRLLRIDAQTAEIRDELALAGASSASVSDDLWVAFEGGVAQIEPRTLDVLAVYAVYPRYGGAIFATPDGVWVREEGERFLTRIDPESQRITETITAPRLPSGGDVVQIDGSLWATAYHSERSDE